MTETERITVAEASDGFGGGSDAGTEISLPVVELLTGRGFVTGKSGSGKSNSASVIAEKLLDNGFGLLIVDIDGEYYGLKEEYEILHAGADEECDIQITADHAEKLAALALEQNVPIILDVSSYLDENEARDVLTAVSRSLFAKAKKQKQPFLLLVEEVHEYIPENGSIGECGRMLIKIGKRGRKHGLGICGISQRPADVKKDFITQCDWLLWHRLTWNNDTRVVGRILDSEYAEAIEDLADGEGFLMTDWGESIERVQFYRKQTFDAGATPGLDDFERPELKSVSDDLVSELQEISDEKRRREDRIAELREELDRKNSQIAELERELQDARDLSRMADQFVTSLIEEVKGPQPGKTERERMRESYTDAESTGGDRALRADRTPHRDEVPTDTTDVPDEKTETADESDEQIETADELGKQIETTDDPESPGVRVGFAANGVVGEMEAGEGQTATADAAGDDGSSFTADTDTDRDSVERSRDTQTVDSEPFATPTSSSDDDGDVASTDGGSVTTSESSRDFSSDAVMNALGSVSETVPSDESAERKTIREQIERTIRNDAERVDDERGAAVATDEATSPNTDGSESLVVRELEAEIADLPTKSRHMLSFYREMGPETPLNAHFAAGGDGSRNEAYAHNRRLRTRGLIEHVGRGHYGYRLRELLAAEFDERGSSVSDDEIDAYATKIESATLRE